MEAPSRRFQIPSRRGELDVAAAFRQFFPSHCIDDGPVLPNELRRILKILRLHFDTAGLPACATRYLEIERVIRGLRIFPMRLNTPAHAVSPCIASNWDTGVGRSDAPPRDSGNAADAFWGFGDAYVVKDLEIGNLSTPRVFRNCRRRCTRKQRREVLSESPDAGDRCRHRPARKTNPVTRQVARIAWLWQPDGLENGPSQAHTQRMSPAGYKFQGEFKEGGTAVWRDCVVAVADRSEATKIAQPVGVRFSNRTVILTK